MSATCVSPTICSWGFCFGCGLLLEPRLLLELCFVLVDVDASLITTRFVFVSLFYLFRAFGIYLAAEVVSSSIIRVFCPVPVRFVVCYILRCVCVDFIFVFTE